MSLYHSIAGLKYTFPHIQLGMYKRLKKLAQSNNNEN